MMETEAKSIKIRMSKNVAKEMLYKTDLFFQYDSPEEWRENTDPEITDDDLRKHTALMYELEQSKAGVNEISRELAEWLWDEFQWDQGKDWFDSGCINFWNRIGIAIGELIPFVEVEYVGFNGPYKSKPVCTIDKKPYMYKG